MALEIQLPCDGEGVCMRCKKKSPKEQTITCTTCATPWHIPCLTAESLTSSSSGDLEWLCPDCSGLIDPVPVSAGVTGVESSSSGSNLIAAIRAIEEDTSLTEEMKAKKRQLLLSGEITDDGLVDENEKNRKGKNIVVDNDEEDVLDSVRKMFNCLICLDLAERPITTPCGHNFCLKCFEKWTAQGNFNCVQCRRPIPKKAAKKIRINSAIVDAIRLAKKSKRSTTYTPNEDLPEEAFTTERAVKTGLANATSGKIKVTITKDHFGPITAVDDPLRNQGVLVGESWANRQVAKQWGVHFPHVSGIAGQAKHGAQSVVLSGGYKEDEDHGEWLLYTGSGGRDLRGNKRTNNKQSSDQKFAKLNEALRRSCKMGYPVRVVRSVKEKRSAYAPVEGLRYDGVYRVEMCWRIVGIQGFIICRYLIVRCDNEPAPWTSNEHGDRPRPLPNIPELKNATDLFVRQETPSWDFDESEGRWKWMKPPPASKKMRKSIKANNTLREKLLKPFRCQMCLKVMSLPVTTPCGHNFCKACLGDKFAGIAHVRERSRGGRTLRAKKNIMICPCCPMDIADFLQNPQVNTEMMDAIEKLTKKEEEEPVAADASGKEGGENSERTTDANSGENTECEDDDDEDDDDDDEEDEEEGEGEEEEEEDEDDDDEEDDIAVSEAEEPPSKKMKLESDTPSSSHCG